MGSFPSVASRFSAAALLAIVSAEDIEVVDNVEASAFLQIAGVCVFVISSIFLLSVYLLPRWLLRFVEWNSHPSVLWSVRTTSRICSLTIDDAPSSSTPAILDILREHSIKATFFIISGHIPGNEEVLRRIVSEGHTLANHLTEDRASILDELHVFEQKIQECERAISEFQQGVTDQETLMIPNPPETQQLLLEEKKLETSLPATNAMKQTKHSKNKWIRPASGWFTTPMREITARHGYRICLGSVYPHDAQIRSETINSMYLRNRTDCGSIIIVHDRSWTIGVLKTALPVLSRKFQFVTLDELVEFNKPLRHEEL
ncbi:chitooligosaccharide deacetylase [Plasmopara halstedii]|uniref:Chitooligosaccharide deacetylase n=1 Tax=Plasmopara halstedii TaxID=4781 RepID=A0A0P1AA94_PLAHL|nr:chitooligosaccharide deacetylase [Plasmopara halstedii]CEG37580.1 chitooligosaccharide deacetylase [Plasmopara halstedii]|eukprot:XP_024573949.1 chitooligosaccharide deacetylase [Plasmopara halstedii]